MLTTELARYNVRDLSGTAYAEIRNAILAGTFLPGVQLNERQLAEQFGVSRTPVRDALRRLNTEGLVRQMPHIGVFVRKLEVTEAIDLLELRRALEAAAADRAARQVTPEETESLLKLAEEVDASIGESDDTDKTRSLELNFHQAVADLSANAELMRVLANVKAVYLTVFPQAIQPVIRGHKRTVAITHSEIARAIASGDTRKAHQIIWDHFEPTLCELRRGSGEDVMQTD